MGNADRVIRCGPSPGDGRGADLRHGASADASSGDGTRRKVCRAIFSALLINDNMRFSSMRCSVFVSCHAMSDSITGTEDSSAQKYVMACSVSHISSSPSLSNNQAEETLGINISEDELEMLDLYKKADPVFRQEAKKMLRRHPKPE